MNDLNFLLEFVNPVILGICLCVGFCFKYAFSWFQNKYIPLSMMLLGCVISLLINAPDINAEIALGGMISGLASTGLYEMMKNLLEQDGKKE